ncbi:MAG: hypothetical protein JWL77_1657 [Chthonomonadaceae bacterium]|nr:hypothetical protein [Chthonomonadaceae bacterium]
MSEPEVMAGEPNGAVTPSVAGEKRRTRVAWLIAALTMLTTMIPYVIGAGMANGRRFMWLGYNLDDSCVYLSWMRQAADGAYRALNLFTTEPQHGMALNPLFLVLGRLAGWTHLPLIAVYHGSRMLFGFVLLLLVWNLITLTVAPTRARIMALIFVCFSAGLGWLPNWWSDPPIQTPIDKWQPEAITYLSLYLSPLFCFAMALQVGILTLLFCGVRTGRMRYAIGAGLCGLALGVVHTYDVASLAAVWTVYLILLTVLPGLGADRKRGMLWLQALVAGAITAPSVLYIYHQLTSEAVFRARAEVKTLSSLPVWVLMGYGLTALLAMAAALILWKRNETDRDRSDPFSATAWSTGADASLLLMVWGVVNFAVAYLPTAIQRKLLQGEHFPIAILAGIGAVWLLQQFKPNAKPWQFAFKMAALTLILSLTNVMFVLRDIDNYENNLSQTKLQRTYLQAGEIEALDWIKEHSSESDAIQPLPWIARAGEHSIRTSDESVACFTPGLIHRHVYCGHWGETPDFGAKLMELNRLLLASTADDERRVLLRKMKVRFLLFSQKPARDPSSDATAFADAAIPTFRGHEPLPSYLQLVHSNEDADVYEVSSGL